MYVLYAVADGLIVVVAYVLALQLRFGGRVPESYAVALPAMLLLVVPAYVGANVALQMYWRGWRYAGLHDVLVLAQSVSTSTGIVFAALLVLFPAEHPIPLSVAPMAGLLVLVGMGITRLRHRLGLELVMLLGRTPRRRLLIVGAGEAGQRLARELLTTPWLGYRPIGFVDDDPKKDALRMHGLRVLGGRRAIASLVRTRGVEVVALAIPSLRPHDRRAILSECEDGAARIKIVPGLPEILAGQVAAPFRDVSLEDLLGRPPVSFVSSDADHAARGSVLITGAAGSIGAELARQIAAHGTQRLILVDSTESGLFDLNLEIEPTIEAAHARLHIIVADVRNARRIDRIFEEQRPAIVFHVAAYKHVPLMEAHPEEAVLTNVVGTMNVCAAAERVGCERVVFISTDKAVDPISIMGATKRVGERIVQAFATDGTTVFCAVRFGNVLGSRGSVVPIFERQLRHGGPLTITHPAATRYFMTIPEAASLIIEATEQATGGEIFILDMGTPVRIGDLARKMIRMHGLRPDADIEIREIGLRPGEKLHEILMTVGERRTPTRHPGVAGVQPDGQTPPRLGVVRAVDHIRALAEGGQTAELVPALFALARTGEGQR
jgi:FlaA1/EpsC-like NDP-sugar epimerase